MRGRVSAMSDGTRQRSALPADMPYILSTWVRSYGSMVPSARRQSAIVEFRRRYVDRIMAQDPHIAVICSTGRGSTLHGYAVALDGAICWAYVAADLRGHGLARQAMSGALGAYPSTISVNVVWPFPTTRFKFQRLAA